MEFFRILLFPIYLFYHLVTKIRNWLYDIKFFKSFDLDLIAISVGNLTVGGTGKTPVVEYLIRLLKDRYKIVTLSRGYKRKTTGLIIATENDSAETIGDEPAQLYKKYRHDIGVAVCEDRLFAIPYILNSKPETDLILLDDAYQHRQIESKCKILITDYNHPFYEDWLLPTGNLRESRRNANRADVVVVTKCPSNLSNAELESVKSAVRKYIRSEVRVFFMNIHYDEPIPAFNKNIPFNKDIILVSGIAQPKPLLNYIQQKFHLIQHFKFTDHHYFSSKDIKKITECYHKNSTKGVSIVFTEKDIMRISKTKLQDILMDYPVFFQPITYKFAQNGSEFDKFIQKIIVNTED